MQIKNIHEKLMESIQTMLIDTKVNLPYYGNFNLFVTFHERKDMPTCAVNMTAKGMNFYYNTEFLQNLTQKEVNFITLHEDFHLLWNHPKRTITGQYDPKLANIAQDMIINHIIWEDIPHSFVEIPKDKDGKNMALFVPKEYKGKLIFEEIYEWLRDERRSVRNNKRKMVSVRLVKVLVKNKMAKDNLKINKMAKVVNLVMIVVVMVINQVRILLVMIHMDRMVKTQGTKMKLSTHGR